MNAHGCVYLLTSPSGKHYVGQTIKNFDWYFNFTYVIGKGRKRVKLFNSINKHGIENFQKRVLAYCFDQDDLNKTECGFIELYNSIENGYNLRTGGSHGHHTSESKVFSDEFRKYRSDEMKSRFNNPEYMRNHIKTREVYSYKITSLDKKEYETSNLKSFCREYNLIPQTINRGGICNGFYLLLKKNIVTGEILLNRMVTQ